MNAAFSSRDDILQNIIRGATTESDRNAFRGNILDMLSNYVRYDKSVFVIQGDKDSCPDFYLRNISSLHNEKYLDYFYQEDPFAVISGLPENVRLVGKARSRKQVIRIEDIVNYPEFQSSEFYCNFLKPANLHHEVVVFLRAQSKLIGFISLFRSERSEAFSDNDVRLLRNLAPFVRICLENILLKDLVELKEGVIDIIERHSKGGILIVSDSDKLIYVSEKAGEICRDMVSESFSQRKRTPELPDIMKKDLDDFKNRMWPESSDTPVPLRNRIIQVRGNKYRVMYQLRNQKIEPGVDKFVIVRIDEPNESTWLDREKMRSIYGLSFREIDIVKSICDGLRNADIAETLYISEWTVKKHIQNICDKLSVRSRTAILNKVLKDTGA